MLLIPVLLALLSPEIRVTQPVLGPATSAHGGVVGTSADRSLVLWMDSRGTDDLYGARVDSSGNVLDPAGIPIFHGPASAAVAPTGSGDFLVALALGASGETDVLRVTRDGAVTARKKIDDTGPLQTYGVQIATNGTNFLVLVSGQRVLLVDADGNVLAGPSVIGNGYGRTAVTSDGRDYMIAAIVGPSVEALPLSASGQLGTAQFPLAGVNPSAVALASNGTNYFLAAAGFDALYTAMLGKDGKATAGPQPAVNGRDSALRAIWDGREYAMVWATPASIQTNDATLSASLVDSAGRAINPTPLGRQMNGDAGLDLTLLGGNLFVVHGQQFGLFGTLLQNSNIASATFVADFPIARTATVQNSPILAAIPNGAVVVWREAKVRAETLDGEGQPTGRVVDIVDEFDGVGGTIDSLQIAFDGHDVVVCWRARGTVYAQRFTTSLDSVDTAPIRIAGSDSDPALNVAALAAGGGVSLLAWRSYEETGNHGAILTSSGSVTPVALPNVLVGGAAWNGSELLVSYAVATGPWPSQGLFPDPPCDIRVLRVAANGAVLDAAPHTIAHLTTYVESIAVASNGGGFLVAWKPDLYQRFGIPSVIGGTFVAPDGTPLSSTPRALSSDGVSEGPFVTPYFDGYAVAWTTRPAYDQQGMQWRTTNGQTTESLPLMREAYYTTGASAVAIGPRLVFAYPRIDDSAEAGGVLRVFVRTVSTVPRRRAINH